MTESLCVGAARVDITPEYSVDLTGYSGREQPATGVLDPIHARAAVFEGSDCRVVLISLDLLELGRAHADVLRAAASGEARTSADHVCIACTHTHSAPAAYPLKDCARLSQRYLDDLLEHVCQVVRAATARLSPTRLAVGSAELRIGRNRCGYVRADRGGPAGDQPADDTLRVLIGLDDADHPACAILHYACHAVCLSAENRKISAEFPGLACRELEAGFGNHTVVLFVNGCAGDINPREEFRGTVAGMTEAAEQVVRAARAAAQNVSHESDAEPARRLAAEAFVVPLPYEGAAQAGQAFMPVAVQHLTLGPAEIVALSGEVLFEIGLEIRRRAARGDLWVAGYCNGGHGYIPTDAALREGGYEPDLSNYYYDRPALQAGSGEKLIDDVVRIVNR